jgi:hypothetical protein
MLLRLVARIAVIYQQGIGRHLEREFDCLTLALAEIFPDACWRVRRSLNSQLVWPVPAVLHEIGSPVTSESVTTERGTSTCPYRAGSTCACLIRIRYREWRQRRQSLGSSFGAAGSAEIMLSLVPQPRARCALAFEVVDRVLERHSVMLQEAVEPVARGDLQELAELMAGQSPHPVRIDRHRFESGTGQILPAIDELRHQGVRQI